MFRNLVANAVFSPSVVSSIGFYVRRLRQEEFTRRLGLIFCGLAVALQGLVIVNPPEPAIAAGPNNIIYSGVTSVDDLLKKYDSNNDGNGHRDIQAIFDHYGISRDDLTKGKIISIRSTDKDKKLRSIGRKAYGKPGETTVAIPGTSTQVYERYLWSWDSGPYSTYKVIQGTTSDGRWFAVMLNCGNLIVDQPPPAPQNPVGMVMADCTAITGWAYDPNSHKQAIKVQVSVKLKDQPTTAYTTTATANLSQPPAAAAGNHGFKVTLPASVKSDSIKTVYSVVAIDTVGGGNNTTLAKHAEISTFCKSVKPPQPTVEVCDLKTGEIKTIKQSEFDSNQHAGAEQCDKIEICQNDKIISIPRYKYNNQPLTCPSVQVCRAGVVVTITSDQRKSSDLDAGLCQQIEVCRENQLVTIVKAERRTSDTDPDPTLLCEEPFPVIAYVKSAVNQTQNISSANGTTAQPGDTIVYTLSAQNIGTAAGDVEFAEDMSDVLEYATLTDADGGQLNQDDGVITWDITTLKPDEETSKRITVKIKDNIPAAPSPLNNLESNNLELRNVWHDDTVVIKVPRPIAKTPEVLAARLPSTGPGTNAVISFGLIIFSAYFYARNRQLITELKYVQVEYANGASR